MKAKFDPTLYFITDSNTYSEEEFLTRVEAALDGGATLLQLREKDKSTREYIALAEKVKQVAARCNVPLIIDDRVDVALAVGADGVHLGSEDMSIATARRILGDGYIIGATAKSVDAARSAHAEGADYLGVGAIFPTTTHVRTHITSVETLAVITHAVPIPVCAIGGLNAHNLSVLDGIDVSGICVVSAVMHASDARAAARELSRLAHRLTNKCNTRRE